MDADKSLRRRQPEGEGVVVPEALTEEEQGEGRTSGQSDKGGNRLFPMISLPKIEMKIEKIAHRVWKTISFDNLPHWLKDNEFLHRNYRPAPMNSFRDCLKSIFRLHTETCNIWTHLLGFVFFVILCMGVYVFGDYITWLFEDVTIHNLPWVEQVMLSFFFIGAMACLGCSFMFHMFNNHSHRIYKVFIQFDFYGIAFLITGSSVPAYYYAFYCTTLAKYTHISILIALCVVCVSISLWSKFSTPKYRPLRFAVFVLLGLYGVVPAIHILLTEGLEEAEDAYAPWGLLLMAVIYISGGGLYVLRIPERFFPGKFDVWGSSHQCLHVFVIAAALVHYDTLLTMVKYRLSASCIPLDLLTI